MDSSNNNVIKRKDDINFNETANKIRLNDELKEEYVDFKEDCYIFVYEHITINFLNEIIDYINKGDSNE